MTMKIQNKRLEVGLRMIRKRIILSTIPLCYVSVMLCLMLVIKEMLHRIGFPFSGRLYEILLYILTIIMIIVGVIEIISSFGKPLFYKKMEKKLMSIGFVDKEGFPPLFLSKRKENKGVIYEFYSSRIPYVQYEKDKEKIETALNVKIIDICYGDDMQHILIKAISGNNEGQGILCWEDKYLSDKDFELIIGESYFGTVSLDISSTPSILIGGATGSGKSKLLKLILMESMKKGATVYLADFKGGVDYSEKWHKACEIVTDQEELNRILDDVLEILEERRTMLINSGTPNISEYNKKTESHIGRIIVACDEVAEVLDKTGLDKEQKLIIGQIESKISTIARLGRAFGIHLVLATQRPDADVLKGQIKNNIGYRICGRADKVLSQIILDNTEGAEKISPNDQGVFLMNTGVLFKAYYFNDENLN